MVHRLLFRCQAVDVHSFDDAVFNQVSLQRWLQRWLCMRSGEVTAERVTSDHAREGWWLGIEHEGLGEGRVCCGMPVMAKYSYAYVYFIYLGV